MMICQSQQDWVEVFKRYESFLKSIPLDKYSKLRKIKVVEQDLPKEINPMPLLYELYWVEKDFVDFDEFFDEYWNRYQKGIKSFKQKYFWGCSDEYVKIGLKARLYRTWMSFLTQLHFMYLWNSLFDEKVTANAELDMKGVDGRIHIPQVGTYDIGISKVSWRREARGKGMRRIEEGVFIFEIPYSVDDPKKLMERVHRSQERKEDYQKMLKFVNQYLERLPNGFVVFKEEYARKVYELMKQRRDFRAGDVLEALVSAD